MKRIEGFKSFEAVGVPSGLVDISTRLYDAVKKRLSNGMFSYEEFEAEEGAYRYPTRHLIFTMDIPMKDSKVNDYKINTIEMVVQVDAVVFGEVGSPKGRGKLSGAGYAPKSRIDRKKFKTTFHDNGHVDMRMSFVLGDEGIDDAYDADHWPNEIINVLDENRTRIISSIGHELKHAYDMGHISKGVGYVSNALYQAYNNERFGIKQIDDFLFYMYYTTRCESMVRSSEVAASMEAQGIEDSKFYEYLKSNDTYIMLKEIREWTFDKMVDDMMTNIDKIRETISKYQDISDLTDDEIVKRILGLAVHRINQGAIDHIISNLTPPSIFGMSLIDPEHDATDEEKQDFINAFVNVARKNVTDPEKYFRLQEKYFHKTADKLLKKLGKLFSLAKPSDVNPLHSKISAKRKNESRIYNWNNFKK